MKQPRPGTCVQTSLAILLDKPVDEMIERFAGYIIPPRIEAEGCTDIELIYVAYSLGVVLCPFAQENFGTNFGEAFLDVYERYDGILVGMLNDPPPDQTAGHAVCKKGSWLIDPTWGTRSYEFGAPYERLYSRVFFALTHP